MVCPHLRYSDRNGLYGLLKGVAAGPPLRCRVASPQSSSSFMSLSRVFAVIPAEPNDKMLRGLQECWRSAQRWLTSMSASNQVVNGGTGSQGGLQECWGSAQCCLTSISAARAAPNKS